MEETQMFDQLKPIPLLICPYCRKNIPLLLLQPFNGEMNVKLKCLCLDGEREISLGQFMRCLSSHQLDDFELTQHQKGNESLSKSSDSVLSQLSLRLECEKHKKPFSLYCLQCQIHYCDECNHDNCHGVVSLSSVVFENVNKDIFNEFQAKNQALTTKLLQRIEAKNNQPIQMKEDIESAGVANNHINEDLALLYQSLLRTSLAFKSHPSFQLMQLRQSIVINSHQYTESHLRSIEEEYIKLKQHLQTSYVLKQASTHECIATLAEHSLYVFSIIQLNDGRLASGSGDCSIKLWSSTTLHVIATLTGHSHYVMCVIQLKDSRLASCSGDRSIKIWNLARNECVATLTGHGHYVYWLLELKEDLIASSSFDLSIKLWSTTSLNCISTLKEHLNIISSLVQLKDGRLVSGSYDNTIKLWSLTTRQCLATLIGHKRYVYSLIQMNDGRLASSSGDFTVKIWDTIRNYCVTTVNTGVGCCLFQLRDGMLLFGCKSPEVLSVQIRDATTFKCISALKGHSQGVNCLIQLDDGNIASCSDDHTIKIWSL